MLFKQGIGVKFLASSVFSFLGDRYILPFDMQSEVIWLSVTISFYADILLL